MKKSILTTVVSCLLATIAFAQAPQTFSYQTVVRDNNWQVIQNQSIGVKVAIIEDVASGTTVYEEEHTATTNDIGLINLAIGGGTVSQGAFANIDWGQHNYFMKISVDVSGGSTYVVMGTTQLRSVPYALFAETSNNAGPQGIQGVAGNDGLDGINGTNGVDGVDGVAGVQGIQGLQGDTGVACTNGIDGIDGVDGSVGAAGSDGVDGAVGATGLTGTAGAAGTNGTNGIDGAVGAIGLTGAAGTNGAVGATGAQGTIGLTGNTGAVGATGLTGNAGAAGTNGTNGIDGAVGATGAQGTIGLTGNTGSAGTNGIDGAVGTIGLTGNTGAVGATGLTGNAGAAGTNGTNGIDGAVGAIGLTGNTGAAGTNGTNGLDGATGLTGNAGTNGTNGIDGVDGTDGNTGAAGTNGTNGTNGVDGTVGATGLTGTAGTNGTNGIDGNDGADGATGIDGTNGVNGVVDYDSLANIISADSSFTANVSGGLGGGCDILYPDGLDGEPITHNLSASYTVPSGKNLYIPNLYTSNSNNSYIDGIQILYGQSNNGSGESGIRNPLILNEGQVMSTSSGGSFNGFLIDAIIEPITHDLSSSYTVPSGKNLYIPNLYTGNSNNSYIDGIYIKYGSTNYGSGQSGIRNPLILNEGQVMSTSSGGSFNGYLADENYFAGCGGGGSSSSAANAAIHGSQTMFSDSTFIVPDGITTLYITLNGAAGGDGQDSEATNGPNVYYINGCSGGEAISANIIINCNTGDSITVDFGNIGFTPPTQYVNYYSSTSSPGTSAGALQFFVNSVNILNISGGIGGQGITWGYTASIGSQYACHSSAGADGAISYPSGYSSYPIFVVSSNVIMDISQNQATIKY